ncbi:MAG: secondary thiamine-phosphate synthase enzyme YjbQ [Thermaerobacter sp.]|nr:secondary thiamine-phosphate synthase enzyme YjbQ [Thermaerobacter sp.]
MQRYTVNTQKRRELRDVTALVESAITASDIQTGIAVVYSPHTTAALTVNENWDLHVVDDFLLYAEQAVPRGMVGFQHAEGNSDSHILVSLIGPSVALIVDDGRLALGQWQGVFLAEFDGPRTRELWVMISPGT